MSEIVEQSEQEVIVFLLDNYVTLYDITVNDDPDNNGGGIVSCNWRCESTVDDDVMIKEIKHFILSVILDAVSKDVIRE